MKATTTVLRTGKKQPAEMKHLQIGGLAFGGHYGLTGEQMAATVISDAFEAGIRSFHTSPGFGRGRGEELLATTLGSTIREIRVSSLATGTEGGSPTGISIINRDKLLECLEGSLGRLKKESIDLYYYDTRNQQADLADMMEALTEVREAGLIRSIGLIASDKDTLEKGIRHGRVDAVLVPYNILNRPADPEFLTFCRISEIDVYACEPLCRGLLAGKLHRNSVFDEGDIRIMDKRFRGDRFRENIEIVERLRHFAAFEGMTPLELALGWVLQHPSLTTVICGVKTPEQLREIIAASSARLKLDQILEVELIVGEKKFQNMEE